MCNEHTFTQEIEFDERFYTVELDNYGLKTIYSKEFRPTGIDGYYIAPDGYVLSLKGKHPKILAPRDNGDGYYQVGLCENGKQYFFRVCI